LPTEITELIRTHTEARATVDLFTMEDWMPVGLIIYYVFELRAT